MIINHNIAALNTFHQLANNASKTSKSLEKLSSGMRINRAGDDAAGLAISEKMRAQVRGLDQAQRNSQDGISMIQTAEGALTETHSILQRMRELATQASNDTNVTVDREELQKEMNQLTSEVNRIGNTTEFNTQTLLKGKDAAVTATAAATTTVVVGAAGVAVGEMSALNTVTNSVEAEESAASVQASTSAATGEATGVTENTESIAGVKSSANLTAGLTIQASEFGADINGKKITVHQGTTDGAESQLEIDGQDNYIFTIGMTDGGDSRATNLGTLYNEMKSAISNYGREPGFTSTNGISAVEPPSRITNQVVALTVNGETGHFAGGIAEQNGVYEFELTDAFEEAGDTITIDGQTFTTVLSGADASKGQFNVGNIEATLTGGETTATAGNDLTFATVGTTNEKVTINVGGQDFTIPTGELQKIGDGVSDYSTTDGSADELVEVIKHASDGTNALSTVADVSLDSNNKIVITAKDPQTQPITWTASGAKASVVDDTFGMNTVAQLKGTGVADLSKDLDGTEATWTTGTLTVAATAPGSATFTFNGVTVNITAAASGGSSVGAVDANSKTVDLALDYTADASKGDQSQLIVDALNAYKADPGASELDNFTFSLNGTSDGVSIMGTEADGDKNNALNIAISGGTTTLAAIASKTAGVNGIDADTSVKFTVDGKDYFISNSELKTLNPDDGSAYTFPELQALVENATDINGYKLSDAATVSDAGSGTLQITSNHQKPTTEVKFEINSDTAADITSLESIFKLTNYVSDQGADAVSSSRSIEDQAKSLAAAIAVNSALGSRFEYASVASGKLTLTETNNKATGTTMEDLSVAGSGADDKLMVTNDAGQNLNTISVTRAKDATASAASSTVQSNLQTLTVTGSATGSQSTRANGVKIELNENSTDALNVSYKDGVLSINMANGGATSAGKNTAANIQSAVHNLGAIDGIDFSSWTAVGSAGWDAGNDSTKIDVAKATMTGGVPAVTEHQLNVSVDSGDLTIHLSDQSVKANTDFKIENAVRDLGEYYYFDEDGNWRSTDFSKYTFTAKGNWNTNTLGNSITKDSDTFVGGTEAVEGQYTFDVTKAFAAGDKLDINGQVFTAVDGVASAANGEFSVSGSVLEDQTASLMTAINLNPTLSSKYMAVVNGTTISLTEKTASGVDLTTSKLNVRATGTNGEYNVQVDELLANGAKFVVDGEEITVSDKNQNVGYGDGTAVEVAQTLAGQTQALVDAINTNANLKDKYVASVADDGSLKLTQTDDYTTDTAPDVSTLNSPLGDFTASFQVGANSGQSMTITVKDMRSIALSISGDGSVGTVEAKNGTVATYSEVANVNSGSDNKSVEYSLDITSGGKASAAISVVNDAIESVSSQRAQLGAFQNRLEHTINSLGSSSENLVAAESRIRDVDMASEMMSFTKNNILSQAAQAMLAQANQQTQGVLQLLK